MIRSQLNFRLRQPTAQASVIVSCCEFSPLLCGEVTGGLQFACPVRTFVSLVFGSVRSLPFACRLQVYFGLSGALPIGTLIYFIFVRRIVPRRYFVPSPWVSLIISLRPRRLQRPSVFWIAPIALLRYAVLALGTRGFIATRITSAAERRDWLDLIAFCTTFLHRTIVPQSSVLGNRKRNTRALARFQSLPDWYVLPDKASLACTVIGNMCPPLLMQKIVEPLL